MSKLYTYSSDYDPVAHGAKCMNCPARKLDPVRPAPTRDPKLVLLLSSPSEIEAAKGRFLSGESGAHMKKMLAAHELSEHDVHVTAATLCRTPRHFQWKQKKVMVECCRPRLLKELEAQPCRTICAAGPEACEAVLKQHTVKKLVGALTPCSCGFESYTAIPVWRPRGALVTEPHFRPVFQRYLDRALGAARGGVRSVPWPEIHTEVNDATVAALEGLLARNTHVGLDLETAGTDPLYVPTMCIGVADRHVSVCIPWEDYKSRNYDILGIKDRGPIGVKLHELMLKLLNSGRYFVTQNGQHDILGLERHGIFLENGFDTWIAHVVAFPELSGYHGLEDIALMMRPYERWKTEFKASTDAKGAAAFVERDETTLRTYCAKDCWVTQDLEEYLRACLAGVHRGMEIYEDYFAQDVIAAKARRIGLRIDLGAVKKHGDTLRSKLYGRRQTLRLIGIRNDIDDYNPSSNAQTAELLFGKLGAPKVKVNLASGAASVDEEVLTKLQESDDRRVVQVAKTLWYYRSYSKLYSTYVRKLLDKGESILRPTPNVCAAKTGRWAYNDPNVHTIPKPKYKINEDGSKTLVAAGLRDIFVAREGMWIVEADYATLELRILAVLAQDEKFLQWFADGTDAHTETAKALFSSGEEAQRQLAKVCNYNFAYGPADKNSLAVGCWRVMRNDFPNLSLRVVTKAVKDWYGEHPAIDKWRDEGYDQARRLGYSEEVLSGVRRHYYGLVEITKTANFPIQSFAATLIKRALVRVAARLNWSVEWLLLQVHDALILEGPDPVRLCTILKEEMEAPVEVFGKPYSFPVDFKVGKSWGHAVEYSTIEEVAKACRG